jgi:2-polyprenyl-6-hydroxyphenyl methylase/3-demethylubiquinone-9 3-methyltransferase
LRAAEVLKFYGGAPLMTRVFLKGRLLLSNLDMVERQVPPAGTIIDLGCGHGLFSNLMAVRSPQRKVIGIDLSPEKIRHAQASAAGRKNIEFIRGDILNMDLPDCDAITIVDVLYLIPPEEQLKVLMACRRKLATGGLLIWKAQERRPRWKFAWTYFQELIATSAGLTIGRHKLSFLSREDATAFLREAGFQPRIIEMPTWRPYTDILYIGSVTP